MEKKWNAISILNAFLAYMSNSEKLAFVGKDDFQCPAKSIFKVIFF